MTIQDIASLLWKHKLVACFVMLIALGVAAAALQVQPKTYESDAVIAVYPKGEGAEGFLPSADTYSLLVGTLAARVESKDGRLLGSPVPGTVEASTEGGRSIVRLTGAADSPEDAVTTAEAASKKFQEFADSSKFVSSQVIEPPSRPDGPASPRPVLTLALAGVLGFGAAILAALAAARLRPRIEEEGDVAEVTDAPILGMLPRQRTLPRGGALAAWEDPKASGYLESVRTTRSMIEILGGGDSQQLLVTSATAGQGKSTLVANLGVAFAQVGIRTIIIDADLRKPQQHKIFGVDNTRGLRPLSSDGDTPIEFLPTGFEALRVLPAGPDSGSAADILQAHFRRVLEAAKASATMVLVDSPPVLTISDARLLAPQVTGIMVVSAAGEEDPRDLAAALGQLRLIGRDPMGIVLNRSKERADAVYGYGRRAEQVTIPTA